MKSVKKNKLYELDATPQNITDKTLQEYTSINELIIGNNPNITNDGIKHLNCDKLTLKNNKNITNIKHMDKLIHLSIIGDCVITNDDIKQLNCWWITLYNNKNITNLDHMNKLRNLDIFGDCSMTDDDIKNLNCVTRLNLVNNTRITKINHMNLEQLRCDNSVLTNESLEGLRLDNLYIGAQKYITKIPPIYSTYWTNIENKMIEKSYKGFDELDLSGNTILDNDSIKDIDACELRISDCPNITDISHMKNVHHLTAQGKCGLDFASIKELTIYWLDIHGNVNIKYISDLVTIQHLRYSGDFISDEEIDKLKLNIWLNRYCDIKHHQLDMIKFPDNANKNNDEVFCGILESLSDDLLNCLENNLEKNNNIYKISYSKQLNIHKNVLLKYIYGIEIQNMKRLISPVVYKLR